MWNEIIGHKKQIDQLKRAASSGKMHHAYLLTGIDGIGKKKIAQAIAAELLGTGVIKPHPERLDISPEDDVIPIPAIRAIQERCKFAPQETAVRIIIIDDAHLMNRNAQNAALKILEEPPAKNHFFLISSMPNILLPTIISRSQRINFSPLTTSEVAEHLVKVSGLTREEAMTAAKFSEGSIGMAITLSSELIESVSQQLFDLFKNTSAETVIKLSEEWKSEEDKHSNILYVISRWFHDALINREPLKKEYAQMLEIIKRRNTSDRIAEKLSLIDKAQSTLTKTFNKQLMFEQLLFNLAS